jgi:hypothetical protein
MTSISDIANLNKQLEKEYGTGFSENGLQKGASNRPLWRIVWSNEQTEHRFGTYQDFIPGTNVLIREVQEVRLVPKYPWVKSRWVLEKFMYAPAPDLPETMEGPHYELIYVFQNSKEEFVPPIWEMVKYIIDSINHGAEEAARRNRYMTPEKWDAMMHEEDAKKEAQIYDELLQEASPIASALGDKEAVSLAGIDIPSENGDTPVPQQAT